MGCPESDDDMTTTLPSSTTESERIAWPAEAAAGRPRNALTATSVAATVLAALFAGFFVTYQISVIRGLALVDDMTYVQTFQAINDTVRTPWFAVIFFGTAPMLAVASLLSRRAARPAAAVFALAVVLAVATVVITFAGNVPLNQDLAAFERLTPELAAEARADFEGPWNRLNLIRTLTALGTGVSAVAAQALLPQRR